MHFTDQRALCSLFLPSGLTVYSCCGCAWQMNVDTGREKKGEAAFQAHHCQKFPRTRDLRRATKLDTLPYRSSLPESAQGPPR